MSEEKQTYEVRLTKAHQEIGNMIRAVAKGKTTQLSVIEFLKVCLYELEADEEIQSALFEYRNKSKKKTFSISVKLVAADLEPVKSLITEVAIVETGTMLNLISPKEACDRIFFKYNEIMRSINESRDD